MIKYELRVEGKNTRPGSENSPKAHLQLEFSDLGSQPPRDIFISRSRAISSGPCSKKSHFPLIKGTKASLWFTAHLALINSCKTIFFNLMIFPTCSSARKIMEKYGNHSDFRISRYNMLKHSPMGRFALM